MSYINKARRRLGRNGRDVGEVLTNNTVSFIERNFHTSPTFHVLEVDSFEFPNIKTIDSRVIEIERMGSIRQVLFRNYQGLNVGAYVKFDDETWLVTDVWGSKHSNQKALIQKCNNELRWIAEDGNHMKFMCVASQSPLGSKSNQGKLEIEWNKYDVKLPLGQLYVFIERNKFTSKIKIDQRFIFGNNVYQVSGVDDTTLTNKGGFGIIQLTTKVTTRQDKDDFENGVAFNKYGEECATTPTVEELKDKGGRIW